MYAIIVYEIETCSALKIILYILILI